MNTTSTPAPATPLAAGITVTTSIMAGARDEGYESQQHAEGIVVSTAIAGGANGGYQSQQHAEGIVAQRARR